MWQPGPQIKEYMRLRGLGDKWDRWMASDVPLSSLPPFIPLILYKLQET